MVLQVAVGQLVAETRRLALGVVLVALALVDYSIDAGSDVVLIGELNVTDRELGYADLAEGLADSYRVAGSGWGHTWRPPSLAGLPLGLLRLDMALSGPGLTAAASEPDCTPWRTDHCFLDVTYVREE
jgi:hypothetical protein